VGWIDAKYQEFFTAVTDPVTRRTTLQNVAKQRRVQNTPEWTANLGLNYTRPLSLGGLGGEVAFIPSLSYRSFSTQFEFLSPLDQKKYALLDASLVWTSDSGDTQVGLHGKNLTDKKYKVAGYDFVTATTLGVEGVLTAFYGDPLTVTATVGLRF
jgi:iron complex outermembrane receptor protein